MCVLALTDSEIEVFKGYLQEDVCFLDWATWCNYVGGLGCCKMGHPSRIFFYKPRACMPLLRRQLIELHLQVIEERAAEYGLSVAWDDTICKDMLVLYDRNRFLTDDCLKEFLETSYDSGKREAVA